MNSRMKAKLPTANAAVRKAVQPEADTDDSLAARFQRTRDQTRALAGRGSTLPKWLGKSSARPISPWA